MRTQNESNLLAKVEEQEKYSLDLLTSERLAKEIASLKEVMEYNEKVEGEMQASLGFDLADECPR